MKLSLFLLTFFLGLVISCAADNSHVADPVTKGWCIVKVSAPYDKLQGFIDYACGKFSCKEILPGGSCFEPNTYQNHASYALNQLYRAKGLCNTDIGVVTFTNPSFGKCRYP